MLAVRLELVLSSVCEENELLAATGNEYKVRVKDLEKKMDGDLLNEIALLQEQEQSNQETERPECENKVLQETKEKALGSAIKEAGIYSRYVEPLEEARQSHFVGQTMSVTRRFGARCGKRGLSGTTVVWRTDGSVHGSARKDLPDLRCREEGVV